MGREEATVPALPRKFILVGLAIPVAVWLLREALAPFFCAMVAAYLLAPLVERLSRRMNRTWATLLVLTATLGLLALLAWALLPVLAGQAQRLVEGLPALKQGLWHRLEPWLRSHPELLVRLQRGLEGLDLAPLLHGLRLAGAGLLGLFLRLVSLILVPVILYYLLVDGPRILAWIDRAVPARHRDRVRRLAGTLHARLGGYIRGQLAVATVMSPLQGAAFALLGVPHAWLLGIVAGFSNLVPYTPYVTALPAALILAGAAGAGGPRLCLIAAAFTLEVGLRPHPRLRGPGRAGHAGPREQPHQGGPAGAAGRRLVPDPPHGLAEGHPHLGRAGRERRQLGEPPHRPHRPPRRFRHARVLP